MFHGRCIWSLQKVSLSDEKSFHVRARVRNTEQLCDRFCCLQPRSWTHSKSGPSPIHPIVHTTFNHHKFTIYFKANIQAKLLCFLFNVYRIYDPIQAHPSGPSHSTKYPLTNQRAFVRAAPQRQETRPDQLTSTRIPNPRPG